MERLSEKQKKILDYIESEQRKKGYPPSVREICDAVGLKSTSTVHGHLERLERKGYLRRDPTKPRALQILTANGSHAAAVPVPVLGKVTAGLPITAVENRETVFMMPSAYIRDETTFMLRVEGESMIEAGIMDRDYVIVKPQPIARNGDIVVAMVEDEATVKRFFKENGHFRLQPENESMDPIIVPQVTIVGKVIGVLRWL